MLLWICTVATVYVFTLLKGSFLPKGKLIFSVLSTSKKIDFYTLLSATTLRVSLQMLCFHSTTTIISKPSFCDGKLCVVTQPTGNTYVYETLARPLLIKYETFKRNTFPIHIYLSILN